MKRNRLLVSAIVVSILINSASVFAEPPKRTVLLYGNVFLSNSSPANGAIYEALVYNSTDGALLSNRTGAVGSVVDGMIYESNNNGTSGDYFNVTVVHDMEIGRWNHVLTVWEYSNSIVVMPDLTLAKDSDGDRFADLEDNCPAIYNPDQLDSDSQNGGDVCDICPADATDTCNPEEAVAATIGASGGSVENNASTARVDIPASALSTDTSISITPDSNITTGFVIKDGTVAVGNASIFGPVNITFSLPVTITLKYNESLVSNESNLDIYYYNKTTGEWGAQNATLDTVANTLTLNVSGFSVYVIAEVLVPLELYATIDINPDTLNLKSRGKWITVYIELPAGYYARDINASTILLNETIQPVLDQKYDFVTNMSEYITDYDGEGILERMVKFDRTEVQAILTPSITELTVTGNLTDGTPFVGSDAIRAIRPGREVVEARIKEIATKWHNVPTEEKPRYAQSIADSLIWWYYSIVPPDLAVDSSDVVVSDPIVGEEAAINATIHNYGEMDAGGFAVELLVDGVSISTDVISLEANSEALIQFTWIAEKGAHDIEIVVDAEDAVAELNEENNIASVKVVGKKKK